MKDNPHMDRVMKDFSKIFPVVSTVKETKPKHQPHKIEKDIKK